MSVSPISQSPTNQGSTSSHAQAAKLSPNNRHDTVSPSVGQHDEDSSNENNPPPTVNMRAKMTLTLAEDHLQDHPDIATHYERTLSIEGSSPKPCIVPGNALQLIDDDPSAPRSQTPSSIIILGNDDPHPTIILPGSPTTPDTSSVSIEPDQESQQTQEHELGQSRRSIPRVRFRSRVRITSGLRKHRRSTTGDNPNSTSPSSSASGSPSSSISAPLRWQADENASWGPIGRRLSAFASSNGSQRRVTKQERERPQGMRASKGLRPDERTPLIRSGRPGVSYVDRGIDTEGGEYDDTEVDEDETHASRAAALRREEEQVFGKWPWRLFNRHWWWWHVEPVLCCCCSDESDFEE